MNWNLCWVFCVFFVLCGTCTNLEVQAMTWPCLKVLLYCNFKVNIMKILALTCSENITIAYKLVLIYTGTAKCIQIGYKLLHLHIKIARHKLLKQIKIVP